MFARNKKPQPPSTPFELVEMILTEAGVNPRRIAAMKINEAHRMGIINDDLAAEAIDALKQEDK